VFAATIRQGDFAKTQRYTTNHSDQRRASSMTKVTPAKIAQFAKRLRGYAAVRRMLRQQDGAAAVEFAMVAAPFLALVFAIMETAIVFFAGQALETAAADSARLIMTGQAQNSGYDQGKFKEAVCAKVYALFNCGGGLLVDVKKYGTFATIPIVKPIANGLLDTNVSYNPGEPGDIVVVRLMYQWPVYVSLLGLNLSDVSGGKRLLMSTVAFRNEPYK
jgi:Flp pilus assembly protein TadG